VLRIATAEFLAHRRVGALPEAGEVVGDLLRATVRREEMEEHRHAAAGDRRRLGGAEQLLDPDREHRRAIGLVGDADPAPARHREAFGREPVDPCAPEPITDIAEWVVGRSKEAAEEEADPELDSVIGDDGDDAPAVRAIRKELHEVRELERVVAALDEIGLSMLDYATVQEQSAAGELLPARFEVISTSGKGETKVHDVPNIRNIIPVVLDIAKSGMDIKRFKGLGEMDAEQLWETTMNPVSRVLLRVTWDAASEAEKLFTVLMGEDVEPRRAYIEEHALDVKNLDV